MLGSSDFNFSRAGDGCSYVEQLNENIYYAQTQTFKRIGMFRSRLLQDAYKQKNLVEVVLPFILLMFLLGASFSAYYNNLLNFEATGSIRYNIKQYFETFHSGRGNGGVISGDYSRDNILYCRMQLFAEINNSASEPEDVLVPNGLDGRNDAWSEGGINYVNLKRNLAFVLDREMIPLMGLWITNIDPLANRAYDSPSIAPKLPIADASGYRLFLESLNEWLIQNYPENGYVIWEPAWEFNLYPWTNWGGAGGNRYWRIYPEDYEWAMSVIRTVLDNLPDRRISLAAHIVAWPSEEWNNRGKLRINGSSGGDVTIGYLNGIRYTDIWGISLYGEWDTNSGYDVDTLGVHGYIDWLFNSIVKQCSEDGDIGDTFIGLFEYNMPEELREMRSDILTNYTSNQLNLLAIEYIKYTYSKIPSHFTHLKMLSWWIPFGSDNQWETWKDQSQAYDGWKP